MSESNLKTDKHGNIITSPVVGWTTATFPEKRAVLLAIDYIDSPQEFGTPKSVQLILTVEQTLDLAATLTSLADRAAGKT